MGIFSPSERVKNGRWVYVAASRFVCSHCCSVCWLPLRPSVFLNEKKKQNCPSLVVLVDATTSMSIGDEVRGQTRWDVAGQAVKQAREFAKTRGPDLDLKFYRFDSKLAEAMAGEMVEEAETGRTRDFARSRDSGSPEKDRKHLARGLRGS